MKAKEYADQYAADPGFETVYQIAQKFIDELKDIILQRKAKVDSAVLAVFKEQDLKWQAFAALTNFSVKPDGFRILVKEVYPKVAELLNW